jgi:hypothetical protein
MEFDMTIGFARIRHDDPPRDNPLRTYPETVPMNNLPKSGKGAVIPYRTDWEMWTRALNSPDSAEWLFTFHSMLFNIESSDPYKAESITCGGNAVKVIAENADFVQVAHWRNDRVPPINVTFFNRPHLVQKVVCFDRVTMQLRKPANGKDVYFPLLSDGASDLWIAKERIEFFPTLPLRVSAQTAALAIRKRPQPSAEIVGYAVYGQEVVILEYRPRGSDVWGRIGEDRWVMIQHGVNFYTSWTMDTKPPLE